MNNEKAKQYGVKISPKVEEELLIKFEADLKILINQHWIENGSDTPDDMLAHYLIDCLKAWNNGIRAREKWYGRTPKYCYTPRTAAPE